MLSKKYFPFIASLLLFITMIIFAFLLLIRWDKDVDISEDVLEINLPVIDWGRYLELSKQPESARLDSDL